MTTIECISCRLHHELVGRELLTCAEQQELEKILDAVRLALELGGLRGHVAKAIVESRIA